MKSILIIGGRTNSSEDREELDAFCEGVRRAYPNADVAAVHVDQLQFVVAPGVCRIMDDKTSQDIATNDLVILRNKMRTYSTIAYCVSRYCATQQVTFFNDYSGYFPGNKIAQTFVFYEQQLPFLKTIYAMDHSVLESAIRKELSLPFVLKDAHGAKGEANYLIASWEELKQRLAQQSDISFIAQEFCPNDRDYRLLLMGNEHMVFKRQGGADTHLNNTSKGATATIAPDDIPPAVIEQTHQLAKHMGLYIAGIDIMPRLNSQDFYFIETNAQPQIFTGALQDEKQEHFTRMLRGLLD